MVICNHVLEHVPNDMRAMREFYRTLRPSGIGFISMPFNVSLNTTIEEGDDSGRPGDKERLKEDRSKQFGQSDHVRKYGVDVISRLENVGFRVEVQQMSSMFSAMFEQPRYGFLNREFQESYSEMYPICYK